MELEKWIAFHIGNKYSKVRIIAFSFAGGSAMIYKKWFTKKELNNIEVIGIELPGRGKRINETRYKHIDDVLAELYPIIDSLYTKDTIIVGYSLGGILAYELAVYLQNKNKYLKALAIIARVPPFLSDKEEKRSLYDEKELIESIKRLNGTPEEVLNSKDLFDFYLQIMKDDFLLVDSYDHKYHNKIYSPLNVYGGIDDKEANFIDLYEWKRYAGNDFNLRLFDGDHFFASRQSRSFVQQLLKDIGGN